MKSIVPTDAVRTVALKIDIYNTFLNMLRDKGCYREVLPEVTRHDAIRKYALPSDSNLNTPDLFIFPYDWRISNDQNAGFLTQFIEEIRKLYPDTDIDIVGHSMGGLVARRYLVTQSSAHPVDRCITLCSPILGAPVDYYRMLTGNFYDNDLDTVNRSVMKGILQHFPGVFELLPSPAYFAILQNYSPFKSAVVDEMNEFNGTSIDDLTQAEIKQFFNDTFSDLPVTQNENFHGLPEQDDWANDSSGVKYLHFVAVQSSYLTPTQATYAVWPAVNILGSIVATNDAFVSKKGLGDETVPFVSAFRATYGSSTSSMWAPNTQAIIVKADYPESEGSIEYDDTRSNHNGVTQNPRLHRALLYFLHTGQILSSDTTSQIISSKRTLVSPPASMNRELLCVGCPDVLVENPEGVTTTSSTPGLQPIYPPGVHYAAGNISAQILYGGTGTYTFTIPAITQKTILALLEIKTKDLSDNVLSVIRFHDVTLPTGSNARLVDTGSAPYVLEIDDNSDGTFDRTINANFVISGTAATDTTPPTVTGQITKHDGHSYMQLTAEDQGSGVKSLVFQQGTSLAQEYTGEILLTSTINNEVVAFATDNVGNRSTLFHFPVNVQAGLSLNLAAGTYVGALRTGYVSLTVGKTGSFTGKVVVDGVTHIIRGKIDINGNVISISSNPAMTLDLHLQASGDFGSAKGYSINGSASIKSPGDVKFVAHHTTYSKGHSLPEAGKYTISLGVTDQSVSIPAGTGYATLTIGKTGSVNLVAKLADGSAFSTSASLVGLTPETQCMIYKPLSYTYVTPKGAKGLLAGTLIFETFAGSDLYGTLEWVKPSQSKGAYLNTFDTSLIAIGSRYTPPAKGGSVLPGFNTGTLELSNALSLSGSAQLDKTVLLTLPNIVNVTNPGTDKLKVTINKANGLFTGSFIYPGSNPNKPTSFAGVLLQSDTNGTGFFLGPNGSGNVSLTPSQ